MFLKRRSEPPASTVLGADAILVGVLRTEEDLRIEGRVEGSVHSQGHVLVSGPGSVLGDLTGRSVTIGGRVEGTVVAFDTLHMLAGGCVRGDAHYRTLSVDHGGSIEGRAERLEAEPEVPEVPALAADLDPDATPTGLALPGARSVASRPPPPVPAARLNGSSGSLGDSTRRVPAVGPDGDVVI